MTPGDPLGPQRSAGDWPDLGHSSGIEEKEALSPAGPVSWHWVVSSVNGPSGVWSLIQQVGGNAANFCQWLDLLYFRIRKLYGIYFKWAERGSAHFINPRIPPTPRACTHTLWSHQEYLLYSILLALQSRLEAGWENKVCQSSRCGKSKAGSPSISSVVAVWVSHDSGIEQLARSGKAA